MKTWSWTQTYLRYFSFICFNLCFFSHTFSALASSVNLVQTGNSKLIMSEKNRQNWIDIRTKTKDDYFKIYSLLGTGDYVVAIDEAKRFLKRLPNNLEGLRILSLALAANQQYGMAAFYGDRAARLGSRQPYISNLRGLAIMHQPKKTLTDYNEAIAHFSQSFQSHSDQLASGLNLGNIYLDLGNSKKAEIIFDKVANRCNNCLAALTGKAVALFQRDRYDQAREVFSDIIDVAPKNKTAKFYLQKIEQLNTKLNHN